MSFESYDDLMQPDDGTRRPDPFPIEQTLEVLRTVEPDAAFLPAGAVYCLSDIKGAELATLRAAWSTISVEQRRKTMEILSEMSEVNFELDFESLAYIGFADEDPTVRTEALGMIWYVKTEPMFEALMKLAQDPVPPVRAAALSALGSFILDGELEEFNPQLTERAQDLALAYYDDMTQDLDVRRRALEAISHCSHPRVPDMIYEAYYDDDVPMRVSAIFAMGSSFDQRWKDIVLKELDNAEPEIVFEAVRAAGRLELQEATRSLIEFLVAEDADIQLQAIWALGEIGNTEAREALVQLAEIIEERGDGDLAVAVDEALDMASLMGDQFFPLLDIEEFDEDEFLDQFDDDPGESAYLN